MNARAWAVALMLIGVVQIAGAAENLIVNGSFELGDHYQPWAESSTEPVTWQAPAGMYSLDLNDMAPGYIVQSFSTTPGATYLVTFALAGNPQGGPDVKDMTVSAAGASQAFSFTITGHSISNMGWQYHAWSFLAVDSTTTLQFTGNTTAWADGLGGYGPYYGPALDDVSVTLVPEPATLALLAVGMVMLAKRRR